MSVDAYIAKRLPKITAKHGEEFAVKWERDLRAGTQPVLEPVAEVDAGLVASPVPVDAAYLPGGLTTLQITPRPRWPVALRNTRALHGLLTACSGSHMRPVPTFSIVPHPSKRAFEWGAYWHTTAIAMALADKTGKGRLYQESVSVSFGPARRFRWPVPLPAGAYRRHIQTMTPVVIRSSAKDGTKRVHRTADANCLLHALSQNLPVRLGFVGEKASVLHEQTVVRVLAANTVPVDVPVGGKFGDEKSGIVTGWEGWILLECNAVSAWLLECAAIIGMGGRTSLGFGRIEVSQC